MFGEQQEPSGVNCPSGPWQTGLSSQSEIREYETIEVEDCK